MNVVHRERQVVAEPVAPPVAATEVVARPTAASAGLRLFQVTSAVAGAVLFGFGLVAIFRVDFQASLADTTANVAGFGFSAMAAIAALILGGLMLVATLADQDRGAAAFTGLLTMAAGIAALIVDGQTDADLQVDHRAAGLFIVLGAVVFVCSLVPWWSRRRVTTYRR